MKIQIYNLKNNFFLSRFHPVSSKPLLFSAPLLTGLEPEIQKLISKHKQELKKLRALHEAELLQADDRVGPALRPPV